MLQTEEDLRKPARLLSSLSDLRLEPKKTITAENETDPKRKDKRVATIRFIEEDDSEIHQHFKYVYRKKQISDRILISKCLATHFAFSYLDSSIRDSLIEKFQLCQVKEGTYLMKQGDSASCFFVMHEGRMLVEINGTPLRKLIGSDGGFGELALLHNTPRSASIKAEVDCYLWYIDRKTFKTAISDIVSKNYNENLALIDKCSFFQELSMGQKKAIADAAINQYFSLNSKICKENDTASSFFILKSGKIKRVCDGFVMGAIEKGQIFEQYAAFKEDCLRKETLIAVEDCHVLAIGVRDIEKSLGKSLPIIIIRNQIKNLLKKEPFYIKLTKHYASKLLDSFVIQKCIQSQEIINPAIPEKNAILLILEGDVNYFTDQKSKEQFDPTEILGLRSLNKALRNQKDEILYDFSLKFTENGKVAKTSVEQIEKLFGCTIREAVKKSLEEKEGKKLRVSKNLEMKEITRCYQLEELKARKVLGEGSFGKVLLVSHEPSQLNLALKCISKKKLMKERVFNFVKSEKDTLNLMSMKDSPFIVKYYRSFKDDYFIYFLMEHIQGQDLFDVIRQIGLLTLEQARFYIAIILHTLSIIHEEKIIYRDLKPQNIIVTKDGYLKLVDMGTCKRLFENQNRTFSIIGTPNYMAPETISNNGYSYSADLWSLGIILYEFVCGFTPYGDDTEDIKQIYNDIIEKQLKFPYFMHDNSHHLMKSCKSLIAQLLDKNPCNRLGGSFTNLKNHAFFIGFNWDDLINKKLKVPFNIQEKYIFNEEKVKNLPYQEIKTHLLEWGQPIATPKAYSKDWDQIFID